MSDIGIVTPSGCNRPIEPPVRIKIVQKKDLEFGLTYLGKKIKGYINQVVSTINGRVDELSNAVDEAGFFVYGTTGMSIYTADSTSRNIPLTPTNGTVASVVAGVFTAPSTGLYTIAVDSMEDGVSAVVEELKTSLRVNNVVVASTTLTQTKTIPGISTIIPLAANDAVTFTIDLPAEVTYPAGVKFHIVRIANG